MPKFIFQCASLLFVAGVAAGCTTTVTATTTSCSTDAAVSCPGGGEGWSCDGSARPDEINGSIACSTGVAINSTTIGYCCASVSFPTGGACGRDSTVSGCVYGSYGFSCTGQARPEDQDGSLTCSMGVPAGGGSTDYCCLVGYTMAAGCMQDPTVASCQGNSSYAFSCTGSATPAENASGLVCTGPSPGPSGGSAYCCQQQTTTAGGCSADPTITGCAGGSSGYSCTGGATPAASLNCSSGVAGPSGDTFYCCGGAAGTCGADGTVTCSAGALGYSCNGSVRPDANGGMECSTGVPQSGGSTGYCCIATTTSTASTCSVDATVTGCAGGSYGFACMGTDRPSDTNTHLTCGDGVAGNDGNTLYCCQGM